jgi:hypothetical protein
VFGGYPPLSPRIDMTRVYTRGEKRMRISLNRKLSLGLIAAALITLTFTTTAFAVLPMNNNGDNDGNNRDNIWNDMKACWVKIPEASKLVINVQYTVINDEASGLAGYWALEHYTMHLTIYLMPNGTYAAFSYYDGVFVTPQGAISPGTSAATETETGFGNLDGCKLTTFTATSMNTGTQLKGSLGTKNYGGTTADVLKGTPGNGQTGASAIFSWSTYYFTSDAQVAVPRWIFTYTLDRIFSSASAKVWVNAYSGNSGDIVT